MTHIAIVRHTLETKKVSNTGRFAAQVLKNSSLHVFGDQHADLETTLMRQPDTWLLFPEGADGVVPLAPPQTLIVLDGTWHQARRMRQRIRALRGLPVLSLTQPVEARSRMRRPPNEAAMSTLEAIAAALRLFGDVDIADRLDALHERIVTAAQLHGRRSL